MRQRHRARDVRERRLERVLDEANVVVAFGLEIVGAGVSRVQVGDKRRGFDSQSHPLNELPRYKWTGLE